MFQVEKQLFGIFFSIENFQSIHGYKCLWRQFFFASIVAFKYFCRWQPEQKCQTSIGNSVERILQYKHNPVCNINEWRLFRHNQYSIQENYNACYVFSVYNFFHFLWTRSEMGFHEFLFFNFLSWNLTQTECFSLVKGHTAGFKWDLEWLESFQIF